MHMYMCICVYMCICICICICICVYVYVYVYVYVILINFPVRKLLNNQRILIHAVDLLIAHLDPNLPEEAGEWKPFKSLLDKTVGDLRLCQSRFRALGERWEDGGHVGNPRLGYLQSQEPTMTCGRLGCTSCNNPRVLFQGMSDHEPDGFCLGLPHGKKSRYWCNKRWWALPIYNLWKMVDMLSNKKKGINHIWFKHGWHIFVSLTQKWGYNQWPAIQRGMPGCDYVSGK